MIASTAFMAAPDAWVPIQFMLRDQHRPDPLASQQFLVANTFNSLIDSELPDRTNGRGRPHEKGSE